MSFNYDLASTDAAIVRISKVRLQIDDTVAGKGVRPDGSNFTDEELTVFLTREGNDEMRAAAAACEALSVHWSRIASITVGPRSEQAGKVASEYRASAEELRRQYGYGTDGGMVSVGVIREDGFASA